MRDGGGRSPDGLAGQGDSDQPGRTAATFQPGLSGPVKAPESLVHEALPLMPP